MHGTVMDFLARRLHDHLIRGKRILEVGSFDVNGSPRTVIQPHAPLEYFGIDIAPGKGVDVVLDARDLEKTFGKESFDVVISAEMLEHVEDWREVVSQMKRVLRPGGHLVVTTRSPGFPYHPHPVDCWRFTRADFGRIFRDLEAEEVCDDIPEMPGIFGCFVKGNHFSEAQLVDVAVMRAPVGP